MWKKRSFLIKTNAVLLTDTHNSQNFLKNFYVYALLVPICSSEDCKNVSNEIVELWEQCWFGWAQTGTELGPLPGCGTSDRKTSWSEWLWLLQKIWTSLWPERWLRAREEEPMAGVSMSPPSCLAWTWTWLWLEKLERNLRSHCIYVFTSGNTTLKSYWMCTITDLIWLDLQRRHFSVSLSEGYFDI